MWESKVRDRLAAMRQRLTPMRAAQVVTILESPALAPVQHDVSFKGQDPLFREVDMAEAGIRLTSALRSEARALGDAAEAVMRRVDRYCEMAFSLQKAFERIRQARMTQIELRWSGVEADRFDTESTPKTHELVQIERKLDKVMRDISQDALNASEIAQRAGTSTRQFIMASRQLWQREPETSISFEKLAADMVHLEADAEKTVAVAARFRLLSERAGQSAMRVEGFPENEIVASIAAATQATDEATRSAQRIGTLSAEMTRRLDRLSERLLVLMRQSLGGDRRAGSREAFFKPCRVILSRQVLEGRTLDLSEGGALLLCGPLEGFERGQPLTLIIDGIGPVIGHVADVSEQGLHVAFDIHSPANQASRQTLLDTLQDAVIGDAALISQVCELSARVAAVFEEGLNRDAIALEDLLSRNYQALDDGQSIASVQQFYAGQIKPLMDNLPAEVLFALVCDRNGYVPFRKAQEHFEENPKLHDDWPMLKAARNLRPSFVQIQKMQNQGEPEQIVKTVSVPILVRGRHWGCAQMGFAVA